MATDAQLMAALTFGSNHLGVSAKTINNAQLARIKTWMSSEYSVQLAGQTVTSEDVACHMWRQLNAQVVHHENKLRDAANNAAAVGDLAA